MFDGEPSREQMTDLLCNQKVRPNIPVNENSILKVIYKLMQVRYTGSKNTLSGGDIS